MRTERLYFGDQYLRQFSARVVARGERGGQPAVALDQSAFYPEGGGQPADGGTLDGVAVLDVQAEGELVWHTLASPVVGDALFGAIDWARRFDHMQQHLGQHLLSAALERLYGLATVSFHLGAAAATIDVAGGALTPEEAAAAEELVNEVIWEDRPVLARFVTPAELGALPLRKPPTVAERVRVVSVPEFDHSACGGTHPRSTGGVGLVHIRRWERRGDVLRVEFLCGGRAARDLRWRSAALRRIAGGLSCAAEEAEAAVERLRASEERARKGLAEAREQLLGHEARELAAGATLVAGTPVVRQVYAERPVEEVRALARATADLGCLVLFGVGGARAQLVVARGASLAVDCSALLRAALTPLGGRGGGSAALAQGGLPDGARLGEALDAAVAALG